ncbi:MAG: hypothetical protein LKE44_10845 [Eubacterium sp.]|jgi:hypothetical protein|nr:hypothetical protein [Eubacterium sp.]
MTLNSSIALQLIFCTIGCIGVGCWYNIKGKQFVFNACRSIPDLGSGNPCP